MILDSGLLFWAILHIFTFSDRHEENYDHCRAATYTMVAS